MVNRKLTDIIKDKKIVALAEEATVQDACRCMWERRVGSVLVADQERRLTGIFTSRDAVRSLAEGKDAATTMLAQVMTRNPVSIAPECRAIDALRAMKDRGFRHLPVVDSGRLVGIITRSDFKGMEIDRLDDEEHLWECVR
ncbi:MAG: cyclic nucleotide-binding/CBS domain-containing protein [Methyloceanibacter sp.]